MVKVLAVKHAIEGSAHVEEPPVGEEEEEEGGEVMEKERRKSKGCSGCVMHSTAYNITLHSTAPMCAAT